MYHYRFNCNFSVEILKKCSKLRLTSGEMLSLIIGRSNQNVVESIKYFRK